MKDINGHKFCPFAWLLFTLQKKATGSILLSIKKLFILSILILSQKYQLSRTKLTSPQNLFFLATRKKTCLPCHLSIEESELGTDEKLDDEHFQLFWLPPLPKELDHWTTRCTRPNNRVPTYSLPRLRIKRTPISWDSWNTF